MIKEEKKTKSAEKDSQKKKERRLKKFLDKNRTNTKILAITSVVVLLTIILFFTSLNARFSVKEDLEINIKERHIEMDVYRDSPAKININSNIKKNKLCNAVCTQKLWDVNSNDLVFSERLDLKRNQNIIFQIDLYPGIKGEGQDIYMYSVSCVNKISRQCPASDDNIEENVIITLNRKLTDEEIRLKESQEKTLYETYNKFNQGRFFLNQSSQIISKLNYAKIDDLEKTIPEIENKNKKLAQNLSLLESVWISRDHFETKKSINETNIVYLADNFNETANLLLDETLTRIKDHNLTVNITYLLAEETHNHELSLIKGRQFLNTSETELSSHIKSAKSTIFFISARIHNKNFNNYTDLLDFLNKTNNTLIKFETTYTKTINESTKIVRADVDLLLTEENNCFISSKSSNLSKSCDLDFSLDLFDFNKNYSELKNKTSDICSHYIEFNLDRKILLTEALQKRENLSQVFLAEVDKESAKRDIYLLKKHKDQLSSRTDTSSLKATGIINEYIQLIQNYSGILETDIDLSISFNSSLLKYALPVNFTLNQMTKCSTSKPAQTTLNLNYEEIPTTEIASYNDSLIELLPRCCFRQDCKECVTNSSENYPIILVHGHGFYSKNSPTIPSQTYNNLQNKFLKENIGIPAGLLTEEEKIIPNSLGTINIAMVYKASYYPSEIRDNESINLFAQRLNSIVQKAKEETGKNKAIIIAHSMGGLVTRTYLLNYGTKDVDKIIILGTPNNGIPSQTVTFCKLFGRNLECDEMYDKSKFMTDLKAEPEPNIPIYTLRGIGCSTFGKDGDGIIQSESVPLKYAKNYEFNGTCSWTGSFHVTLANPEQNPNIYKKIKELIID